MLCGMAAIVRPETTSVPLDLLDELFLNLDRADEPWGVHLEVHVTGRLDTDRLAGAVAAATRRHPIARAQLARWHRSDLGYRWEIAGAVGQVPLGVVSGLNDAALDAARELLFAASPSLETPPPFAVVAVHGPAGDSLLLNLHHAAGDGIAAVRLMRSILRAYADEDDPVPALDALAVRDVRTLAGAATLEERLVRGRALARHAARGLAPATRLAREGQDARPAYGFRLIPFTADETAAVAARRAGDATVNDVLLAALAVAVRRWNAGRGRRPGRVALSMPVNLRPAAWRTEVVANLASYVTVSLPARATVDLPRAVAATAARTRRIKRDRLAGLVVDLLAGSAMVPVGAKRRLPELIALAGDRGVDTASLSNLGLIEPLPAPGGSGGTVDAIWFSPPLRMPLGAGLGAATLDGRLHIALRHRHPQLDGAGAAAFARLYRDVLLG
jgi:NRPS condensation-like uncharacterized protein